nr:hypothetical protein [Tanacetum cinerariifolium]
ARNPAGETREDPDLGAGAERDRNAIDAGPGAHRAPRRAGRCQVAGHPECRIGQQDDRARA